MGSGFHSKPFSSIVAHLLLFTILPELAHVAEAGSDYTTLVYKGCSQQEFSDPNGGVSQALSALFGSLVSQSPKAKFSKSTAGSGQTSVNGLFQCRGDLSNSQCYDCVSRLPVLSDKLCGKTIAARVQLTGCYMLYEVSGFKQVSGMELLFKTCGSANGGGTEFQEKRDTAFSAMVSGVAGGHGFYVSRYESVYVLGQCEGDVGDSDCGECVKSAVQKAQVECGRSVSGQIYLNKCFITYGNHPDGGPKGGSSSSSESSFSSSSPSSSGQATGKTAAIIVGGIAGLGFLVICLLFARTLKKKHEDD